jgi:hypothetical protein
MRRLCPWRPCPVPELPSKWVDVLTVVSRCEVGFWDRVRILVTGRLEVESRVGCENLVGQTKTESVLRAGRHWKGAFCVR